MEYHQQASSTFSRKLSTGRGMSGKHAYDGVFGNPGKLGNPVEDYREIFSGSQTCSIPILDAPELHDGKVAADAARSTRVDYSKIFGGFGDGDCGVSFEDLLAKPKEVTRTPAEARVRSAQSGHSVFQREKVVPSSEASLESFHGVKQFNMSYHKTNPGSKNGCNGLTRIAELHAVPGYTCLIDENVTYPKTEDGKLACSVLDDSKLNTNVEELIKRDKTRRKVVSGPQPRVAAENIFRSHADFRKKSTRNKSISNDMSFDAFGFGIGESPSSATPVSKLASNVGNHKDVSSRSTFGAVRNGVSEGKPGNYSPPSLDEEVDSNSAAAASAAAVRKAIEEAQLKIKIAKQLMERKREGFHSRARSSSKNGLKPDGKPEVKSAEKGNGSMDKEAQEMCEKKGTPGQAFTKMAEHNLMKAREAMLDVRREKESPIHKNAFEKRHSSESNSTQEDYMVKEADDCKVTRECFKPAIPKELSATQLQFEQVDNEKKMMASAKESELDQNMTAEERFQQPKERGNNLEAFEGAPILGNIEIKLNSTEGAFEGMCMDDVKSVQEFPNQEAHKDEMQVVPSHEEADQTHGASCKADNCEKELEILHETKDNIKIEIKEFEDPRESNGMHGWTEIENIQSKAENQVEIDKNLGEAPLNEGNMGGLDELHGQKQNHNEYGEPQENVESERIPDVDCREETEVDACSWQEPWDCEKSGEAHVQEVAKVKFNEISYKDENENPFIEDELVEENEKLEEIKENEDMLERNYETNKAEYIQEKNFEEATVAWSEIFQRVEGDDNLEAADDVYKQDENEYLVSSEKAYTCESGEAHMVNTIEGNGITEAYFESKETVEESEAVEEANDLEGEEKFEDAELNHDEKAADATEAIVIGNSWVHLGETDMDSVDRVYNVTDYSHEKHAEEMLYSLGETGKDANESTVCPNDEENEMNSVSENEKCSDSGMESTACNNLEEDFKCSSEVEDNHLDVQECEIIDSDDKSYKSSGEEICTDKKIDGEVSSKPCEFEEKRKNAELSQVEKTIQSSNKEEEKCHKTEEGKPEDNLQSKVEVEIKQHKKKEETREREIEKERERERLAVERAIREARERAFAEARERAAAEKAAAGAHQREAEARQRLEKASAEAKKSASEKAFMEAKLKAERAAVERATAEARERALEKALSEKAAANARNQADKFSGASRDERFKSTDKGTGSFSSSRYSSSSNCDGPISTSRAGEANGESAQRCKARFERHQRTADRAAKALAEKNMRDLLAQKEQGERNRLAETLDADVKRWSSGKERNLRALLSTLQYILGPDSGWQPIPLIELISTNSVKKAYRKATLCVHPDKLQQRGATIQQKYTCEKVFDLLKGAWNKFSAEER